MKIDLGKNTLELDIEAVEKYYGSKYVGEFPLLKSDDTFASNPVSIFWRPVNLRGKNSPEYFGITHIEKRPFGNSYGVIDATYITEYIFNGLAWGDAVVYSRFEADRRTFENAAFIEGGFTKRNWHEGQGVPAKLVRLQVQNDAISILEDKK